jgi:hypothetical protein
MFFHILKFPILVFAVNVVLEMGGIYAALPWIDMPMHFLGGASIAVAGMSFLAFLQKQGLVNELPFVLRTLFVMSFVGFAAVSWELWEFSIDFVLERHLQRDLFDTMTDMFFGLLGGLTASITLFLKKKIGS